MKTSKLQNAACIALRHGRLRTPDGADLRVYEAGAGPGPILILVGGICGDVDAFRPLIDDFARWHRVVAWDYRGLYGSSTGVKRDPRLSRHAADMALVLDHFHVQHAVAIGWSMGARVALEAMTASPGRITGLIAIGGTFGRPFRSLLEPLLGPLAGAAPMLLKAAEVAALGAPAFPPLLQRISRRPLVLDGLRLLGAVGETIDGPRLAELLGDAARTDPAALTATLYALGEYCAETALTPIDVPALLIAGTKDPFTTIAESRKAAEVLNAELTLIPSGTHFAMIEFPELVHLRIDAFLRRQIGFDRLNAA